MNWSRACCRGNVRDWSADRRRNSERIRSPNPLGHHQFLRIWHNRSESRHTHTKGKCSEHGMIIVISVLAPSFTKVSGNVLRLYPDGGITLDCKAFGIPKPTVQWTRSLVPLPQGRSEELDGGLVISDMQEQDSGNYTCTASNAVGVINATTELLLRGKTSMLLKGSTPERNAILAVVGFHSVKFCPCLPKKLSSDGRTRWFSETTLDTNRSSMSTWNPWKLGESSGSGASGRLNTCTVPRLFTPLVTTKARL